MGMDRVSKDFTGVLRSRLALVDQVKGSLQGTSSFPFTFHHPSYIDLSLDIYVYIYVFFLTFRGHDELVQLGYEWPIFRVGTFDECHFGF